MTHADGVGIWCFVKALRAAEFDHRAESRLLSQQTAVPDCSLWRFLK